MSVGPVANSIFHLRVLARNRFQRSAITDAVVSVKSTAFAQDCPSFPFNAYRASIAENSPVGALVLQHLSVEKPELYEKVRQCSVLLFFSVFF